MELGHKRHKKRKEKTGGGGVKKGVVCKMFLEQGKEGSSIVVNQIRGRKMESGGLTQSKKEHQGGIIVGARGSARCISTAQYKKRGSQSRE